jgi:glycosyltransferase involved in cell wall biosynthesis
MRGGVLAPEWLRGAVTEPTTAGVRRARLALISSQAYSITNFRGPLIRDWIARGVRVFALAPDYDAASRAAVAALGAEPVDYSLERASIRPLRDLLDMFGLVRILRRLQPDFTFTYFIKPVIYGTFAARLAGVPNRFAMVEGAGYVYSDGGEALSLRRRLLRTAVTALYRVGLSGAHGVFFLNRDDVDLFVGGRMVAPDRVRMLGGIGVDLAWFAVAAPVLDPPVFILAARLLAEKGVREYVEAARRVRAAHPSVRFLLLGGIDLNPGSVSEAELRSWHAEGVVEWHGHIEDVRPLLARASVFVLPSYYREGVPRSIQEAMAMGRPIITTDTPGCRDTVEPGANGWLVPVRDPAALAAAMSTFIDSPELIPRMGAESRRRAEAQYDVRHVNARIIAAMGLG